MSDRMPARRGFSGVEILIVLSVMAVLASMTMPMLLVSMRRARVHEAANAIMEVSSQARRLERRVTSGADYYGVVIYNQPVGPIPRCVALTYAGSILMEGGKPVSLRPINANVDVFDGGASLVNGATNSQWMYRHRTALPIQVAASTAPPVSILGLELRTLDGRLRSSVSIYSVGLINVQDR